MSDAKRRFEELGREERELQFERFSREDAFALGCLIHERAKKNPLPLGIEIVLNGLTIFQFYPTGITRDHILWLARKRHTVEFREMSSLRLKAMAEMQGATEADWKVDPDRFALGGGGYPIALLGTGMIGSVCVSGFPHLEDHQIIVDCIRALQGTRSDSGRNENSEHT